MGEAADAANNLTAVVLFWLWWVLLSFIDVATQRRDVDAGNPSDQTTAKPDSAPDTQDTRFIEIARLDPGFNLNRFLEGARRAYEIIIDAYAAGDLPALKPLLSPDVFAAFERTFSERLRNGGAVDFALIGIGGVDVMSVAVSPDAMEVTLAFHVHLVWAERAADGTVVSGDPSTVAETTETWTFARSIPVEGPAWTVVATGL